MHNIVPIFKETLRGGKVLLSLGSRHLAFGACYEFSISQHRWKNTTSMTEMFDKGLLLIQKVQIMRVCALVLS